MKPAELPGVVAHRGYAGAYPENTLPAVIAALRAGARFVEFDVQLSADGVPVVLHDDNLLRTAGVDVSALTLNASQLTRIEVNEGARLENRFSGVRLPLLRDVLAVVSAWPESHAFVELKQQSIAARGLEPTVASVVAAMEQSGAADQCTLISFDAAAMELARQSGCRSIGWVLPRYDTSTAQCAKQLAPAYLFCDHRALPDGGEPLWSGPWQWAIYEVTTRQLALSLAARGVQLIETMQLEVFFPAARDGA